MTVSVVIPLYNKAPYIGRAVDSVLAQSVQDFEILIIDDGSTDSGGDVVSQIRDPRIHLSVQENVGVSAARNRGARHASSDLVAFLDADDAWEPDFLATVLDLQARFPQAVLWGTAYRIVRSGGATEQPAYHGRLHGRGKDGLIDYFAVTTGRSPLCASAVLAHRDTLLAVGGFPPDIVYGEDHDTWLRLALRFPIAWTSHPTARVYENVQGRTRDALYLGNFPFLESVREFLREQGPDQSLPDGVWQYVARRHTGLLPSKLLIGERRVLHEIVRDCRRVEGYAVVCWAWYLLSWIPHPLIVLAWETRRRLTGRPRARPLVRRIRRL